MFVTRFWFNLLFTTRLSQCLSQGFGQLLVTCHKVVTQFVTMFWFNYWLLATKLPQCLSHGFGSIIGYLTHSCHNVCHKILVLLLVICHKVTTMFVTSFWFNYWLFATRFPQCLLQGFTFNYCCYKGTTMLATRFWFDYLVTCHKGLTQLLDICYTVVTKFWFNYWLFDT